MIVGLGRRPALTQKTSIKCRATTRRRVLVQLIDGPGYPAEMADDFGATRANLSNHLTCLRECGLVTATAEGRRVRYELADQRLADGLRILAALDLPGTCQ